MLMKWEDLEPGDVVRFTDEIIAFYESSYPSWASLVKNENFVVGSIENQYCDHVKLNLLKYGKFIYIKFDGTPYKGFQDYLSGPILEIVSLKE